MRRTILIVALACIVPSLFLAMGAARPVVTEQQLWEYKAVSLLGELAGKKKGLVIDKDPYRELEKNLNELGSEGWELCHGAADLYVFKRPKRAP